MTTNESTVSPVSLPPLGKEGVAQGRKWVDEQIGLIRDVKVSLAARLGRAEITVSRLFALKEGETITLEESVDAPVDLILEGKVVARGQIVAVDDRFGVRITEILQEGR